MWSRSPHTAHRIHEKDAIDGGGLAGVRLQRPSIEAATVVIPAFAVGRTQAILWLISADQERNLRRITLGIWGPWTAPRGGRHRDLYEWVSECYDGEA